MFDRESIRVRLADLALRGVWIGTSSWKYPGWIDALYHRDRYIYRGRFSKARFERLCLREYAEVFQTVCVDAAYYAFPRSAQVQDWMDSTPPEFQFTFKVTDDITLKRFPSLPRFGLRAGQSNPDFLNARRFVNEFLAPLAPFAPKVGTLVFEFSTFHPTDFHRGRDFVQALEAFLSALPKGWRYAVELRNRAFLQPDYFSMLSRVGVAHVFNSWEAMPSVEEQLRTEGTLSHSEFTVARLLLKPGRKYADAVALFSPYQELKDPYPSVREAARELIRRVQEGAQPRKAFLYVNNRLEGSALKTIEAIITPPESECPPRSR